MKSKNISKINQDEYYDRHRKGEEFNAGEEGEERLPRKKPSPPGGYHSHPPEGHAPYPSYNYPPYPYPHPGGGGARGWHPSPYQHRGEESFKQEQGRVGRHPREERGGRNTRSRQHAWDSEDHLTWNKQTRNAPPRDEGVHHAHHDELPTSRRENESP